MKGIKAMIIFALLLLFTVIKSEGLLRNLPNNCNNCNAHNIGCGTGLTCCNVSGSDNDCHHACCANGCTPTQAGCA